MKKLIAALCILISPTMSYAADYDISTGGYGKHNEYRNRIDLYDNNHNHTGSIKLPEQDTYQPPKYMPDSSHYRTPTPDDPRTMVLPPLKF